MEYEWCSNSLNIQKQSEINRMTESINLCGGSPISDHRIFPEQTQRGSECKDIIGVIY